MRIYSALPIDRMAAGVISVLDDQGRTIFGPVRARGEADNSGAIAHGNVQEDPTKAHGDHPYGSCRVLDVVRLEPGSDAFKTYAPFFIRLRPIACQALDAVQNGRTGIGLHAA